MFLFMVSVSVHFFLCIYWFLCFLSGLFLYLYLIYFSKWFFSFCSIAMFCIYLSYMCFGTCCSLVYCFCFCFLFCFFFFFALLSVEFYVCDFFVISEKEKLKILKKSPKMIIVLRDFRENFTTTLPNL